MEEGQVQSKLSKAIKFHEIWLAHTTIEWEAASRDELRQVKRKHSVESIKASEAVTKFLTEIWQNLRSSRDQVFLLYPCRGYIDIDISQKFPYEAYVYILEQ